MEPWVEWEDWQAGMYRRRQADPEKVRMSALLLSDPNQFLEVAHEMIRSWPVAAYHNLVEVGSHRRSWTGQASCCYAHGATGGDTVAAWGGLSNVTQREANRIADLAVDALLRGGRCGETLFGD